MRICVYVYMCICMYAYTYLCMYLCAYIHRHVHVHVHVHVYVYVCVYAGNAMFSNGAQRGPTGPNGPNRALPVGPGGRKATREANWTNCHSEYSGVQHPDGNPLAVVVVVADIPVA